jgi:hypothetical protein
MLVAAVLSVMRFPTIDLLSPLTEIIVDIVAVDAPAPEALPVPEVRPAEPFAEPEPDAQAIAEAAPPVAEVPVEAQVTPAAIAESPAVSEATPAVEIGQSVDWEAEMIIAVRNAVDQMENPFTVNPNFEARRREAAIKFRPSEAPIKKEIWDYVEKDQAGRTVLRFGNFYQVLDDPRLFNRDAFLTFERHMVFATYRKYIPKELPWVKEVRNNHAYLRIQEDRRNGIFDTEQASYQTGSRPSVPVQFALPPAE